MKQLFAFILIFFILIEGIFSKTKISQADWATVDKILTNHIHEQAFPGCVALVASENGILYHKAFGNFTYGEPTPVTHTNPPFTIDSLFDMASLTKVLVTTTAIMTFYQRGELNLNMKLIDPYLLGPDFDNNGKGPITTLNLLLHNAGFPGDPDPGYSSPSFGCPQSKQYHPIEDFSCQTQIYYGLMKQTLNRPVGYSYLYSDLSMITAMYVIGKLAKSLGYITPKDIQACPIGSPGEGQCYYYAYINKYVLKEAKTVHSAFLPSQSVWYRIPPTWNDTVYRHEIIQGQVSDENAYALGGIAGHAGFFSTATDVHSIIHRIMFAKANDNWVNKTTMEFFTKEYNHSQSSRALGWDTNDCVLDTTDCLCGNLSALTWTHTGFTGTQVCADPERQIFTVLLTNRVYPSKTNEKILQARRDFNNAVIKVLDSMKIAFLRKKKSSL